MFIPTSFYSSELEATQISNSGKEQSIAVHSYNNARCSLCSSNNKKTKLQPHVKMGETHKQHEKKQQGTEE